jgi:hypothetical protein
MNRRQKPAETFENDPKLPKTKRSAALPAINQKPTHPW